MRVRDVMERDIKTCTPETNLAAVSELFWSQDCGSLPVIESGRVVGMVTDRDIAIALGTRNSRPGDMLVRDVAVPRLYSCKPEDDVHDALRTMRTQRVRRLPVVDANGKLEGILCLGDLSLQAHERRGDLTHGEIVEVLQSVSNTSRVAQAA
jgi:CBS domain-containing protein